MSRIELNDTGVSSIQKVSEGNPGAISVCMQLIAKGKEIDPQAMMGGLGIILSLDALGLYGPQIWMLYKDVCGENLIKMIAVLRANQLGFISKEKIIHATNSYGKGIDVENLLMQVKKRLKDFAKDS